MILFYYIIGLVSNIKKHFKRLKYKIIEFHRINKITQLYFENRQTEIHFFIKI